MAGFDEPRSVVGSPIYIEFVPQIFDLFHAGYSPNCLVQSIDGTLKPFDSEVSLLLEVFLVGLAEVEVFVPGSDRIIRSESL